MSTSANVIEYTIYKNGEEVGNFRKHMMCRLPDYADLLKHQPLSEHTILAWGYDEEEEYWDANMCCDEEDEDCEEDGEVNLDTFLRGMIRYNKKIKEYYENNI